jgi:predicted ATPase
MEDKLVTIAEYMDSIAAEMDRQTLEDFKIPAIIVGPNAGDGRIGIVESVKLQVRQNDADEARQILEDQQQGHEPEDYEVGDDSPDDEYDPQEEEQ